MCSGRIMPASLVRLHCSQLIKISNGSQQNRLRVRFLHATQQFILGTILMNVVHSPNVMIDPTRCDITKIQASISQLLRLIRNKLHEHQLALLEGLIWYNTSVKLFNSTLCLEKIFREVLEIQRSELNSVYANLLWPICHVQVMVCRLFGT